MFFKRFQRLAHGHQLRRLSLIIAVLCQLTAITNGEEPVELRVAGYLPDYRAAEFDTQVLRRMTDLILFSAEPKEDGGLELGRLNVVPWRKLQIEKTRQRVRLILSIGGWERSKHFATVSGDDDKRRKFVDAVTRTCLERRLDGIDIDWEHPKNAKQEEDYGRLLSDLRKSFGNHGLTLSATIAAWQKLPQSAIAAVDWVHVMAYDHDGPHATFDSAKSDAQAVQLLGVPPHKIVLGLPFYGRHRTNRDQVLTYAEIVAKHRPGPEIDEVAGIYFNGPAMIRRKMEFVRQSKLGGVMIWELSQDAAGKQSLLPVIECSIPRVVP